MKVALTADRGFLLEAELTDGVNPLSGKTVDFYYSLDGQEWSLIDSRVTDEEGKCSTSFSYPEDVKLWFKARFEGDDVYDACEDVAVYEPPPPPPPPPPMWLQYIVYIVPLLIVLSIVLMLVKRVLTSVKT